MGLFYNISSSWSVFLLSITLFSTEVFPVGQGQQVLEKYAIEYDPWLVKAVHNRSTSLEVYGSQCRIELITSKISDQLYKNYI